MRASTWRCSSVCGCGKYSPFDTTWVGIGEPSASASSARINPAIWRSDSQESSSREPGRRFGMSSSSLALTMPFYAELSRRTRLRAPERGGSREHERLDHDRHGAGGLEQRADVYEVEFLQDDPVDRDDRIGKPGFLPAVDPDQSPDVAVSDQDERQAAPKPVREAGDDSAAEGVQPPIRRRALPTVAKGHRPLPAVEIEPAQRGSDRFGYSLHGESLGVERQIRRDDRHVLQREHALRRDEDRAAAHLDRVLGGADHGGADPFGGGLDSRSPTLDSREDRAGERRAEIAEGAVFTPVDVFRNAARKADHVRLAPVAQAPEPKAARVASSASPALTETKFPAWEANSSPIARALLRRTATPVRIRAPVSIALESTPASSYCLSMKRPSARASMLASLA